MRYVPYDCISSSMSVDTVLVVSSQAKLVAHCNDFTSLEI